MKNESNEVMLSSIIPRKDNLAQKGLDVNILLKYFCEVNNFTYFNNDNINVNNSNLVDAIKIRQFSCIMFLPQNDSDSISQNKLSPVTISRDNDTPDTILHELKLKNKGDLLIAHLNINYF